MSDDDGYACHVRRCAVCGESFFVVLGEHLDCLECDAPLCDTGEVVIVNGDGVVVTIQ
jgi:hypothetical protein